MKFKCLHQFLNLFLLRKSCSLINRQRRRNLLETHNFQWRIRWKSKSRMSSVSCKKRLNWKPSGRSKRKHCSLKISRQSVRKQGKSISTFSRRFKRQKWKHSVRRIAKAFLMLLFWTTLTSFMQSLMNRRLTQARWRSLYSINTSRCWNSESRDTMRGGKRCRKSYKQSRRKVIKELLRNWPRLKIRRMNLRNSWLSPRMFRAHQVEWWSSQVRMSLDTVLEVQAQRTTTTKIRRRWRWFQWTWLQDNHLSNHEAQKGKDSLLIRNYTIRHNITRRTLPLQMPRSRRTSSVRSEISLFLWIRDKQERRDWLTRSDKWKMEERRTRSIRNDWSKFFLIVYI